MFNEKQNFNDKTETIEKNIKEYIEYELHNPCLPTSKEVSEIIKYLNEDINEYKDLMGTTIDEYYYYANHKTIRLEQTIDVIKYYEKFIKDDDYKIEQRRLDYSE